MRKLPGSLRSGRKALEEVSRFVMELREGPLKQSIKMPLRHEAVNYSKFIGFVHKILYVMRNLAMACSYLFWLSHAFYFLHPIYTWLILRIPWLQNVWRCFHLEGNFLVEKNWFLGTYKDYLTLKIQSTHGYFLEFSFEEKRRKLHLFLLWIDLDLLNLKLIWDMILTNLYQIPWTNHHAFFQFFARLLLKLIFSAQTCG